MKINTVIIKLNINVINNIKWNVNANKKAFYKQELILQRHIGQTWSKEIKKQHWSLFQKQVKHYFGKQMNPLVELKRRLTFTLPQKISSKHIDSTQQMMRSKENKNIYIKKQN